MQVQHQPCGHVASSHDTCTVYDWLTSSLAVSRPRVPTNKLLRLQILSSDFMSHPNGAKSKSMVERQSGALGMTLRVSRSGGTTIERLCWWSTATSGNTEISRSCTSLKIHHIQYNRTVLTMSLRIGIFGGGVVGGGVVELLKNHFPAIEVVKMCVRSLDKPRDFETSATFTSSPADLLEDDSLDCIVEVMGGTGLAETVVDTALAKGKTVVTANKALLAEQLSKYSAGEGRLAFEAAVCGGIPIINILQTAYAGDTVTSIMGICNGTTNFMLDKMDREGAGYADVLAEAQALGYAEADPTADVEGHDVRAKICLLAKLGMGTTVGVGDIPCQGISKLTVDDFALAKQASSTIKLIGKAALDNGKLSVYVTPMLVPLTSSLAGIHGPGNAVTVISENMGACTYTGPGAGRYPTANSVVADLARVAAGAVAKPFPRSTDYPLEDDYTSKFYIRLRPDSGHSTTTHGIGVEKRLTTGTTSCWITQPAQRSAVEAFCAHVEAELFFPVLE